MATLTKTGGTGTTGHVSGNGVAKTEVVRDTESFADIVRGLHVYGRKVLRTESIAKAFVLLD